MIRHGKHSIKNYMTLDYGFTGIRIQDGCLSPVDWYISIDLATLEKKSKPKEEIEHKAGIAYQKIYFWLDTNLPGIIAVDVGNDDDLYLANLTSNIMMYCPGNPGDDIIIQLLHAKISALAGNDLMVCGISLKGSDTSVKYTFDCQDSGSYSLPSFTSEYYKEGTARDSVPWWFRDDGFCFEFIKPNNLEISDEELFSDIIDPMDEFSKIVLELSGENINLVKEPAKIVQVEKWKPKKV